MFNILEVIINKNNHVFQILELYSLYMHIKRKLYRWFLSQIIKIIIIIFKTSNHLYYSRYNIYIKKKEAQIALFSHHFGSLGGGGLRYFILFLRMSMKLQNLYNFTIIFRGDWYNFVFGHVPNCCQCSCYVR